MQVLADAGEIDIDSLSRGERRIRVLDAFDALAPGDALVLVAGAPPLPLLREMQAERAFRFDWNVLEWGPQRFRVEIRRRESPGPHSVTGLLQEDHRRLDAILAEVKRCAGEGAVRQAAARFAAFSCGLDRHIVAEEEELFPAFEARSGLGEGPTRVMRAEHTEIRRLMGQVATALARQDVAAATPALGALTGMLLAHNGKEERILYPMADRAFGNAVERDALVLRIQAAGSSS